jgi:hypothetical protein
MKKKSKIVLICSLIAAAVLIVVVLLGPFILQFVFRDKALPPEMSLWRLEYEHEAGGFFGPGGGSHGLKVYKLSDSVAKDIEDGGTVYLNDLKSSIKAAEEYRNLKNKDALHRVGFSGWKRTPVGQDERWFRYGRDLGKGWQPTIRNFLISYQGDTGKNAFISGLSGKYARMFDKAVASDNSYYAFGGYRSMCLLIVSPSEKLAFYLYRD